MTAAASAADGLAEAAARDAGLQRGIGPVGLAAAIVNIVIGAGIFALPASMARTAGPYALVAYLLCAGVMATVTLCFAEAGSRVSTSGGIYGYVDAAYGPRAGFVAGVLLWIGCVLAAGGVSSAFAAAVARLVPALAGGVAQAIVAVAALAAAVSVNLAGVDIAARVIGWTTAIKLIPLALFVLVGIAFVHPGEIHVAGPLDLGGIGRAMLIGLFAFQGMETTLAASGEVRNPAHALPRALIGAMAFVAIVYVAIQFVAQGLLGAGLGTSAAPLADAIATVDPRLGLIVAAGTAVSLGGWLGSDVLGSPRILFAFARDGVLPHALARVSPRTGVPHVAILVHAGIAALLAVTGTFETLIVLSTLTTCALYAMSCAAAWTLRRRDVATAGRPLRVPGLGPWVAIGIASMIAAILLGRWIEIATLVGEIVAAWLLYAVGMRRRAGAAG